MARLVVTDELIVKMNELYLDIGTYSGVSRALGGSPSPTTVKRYIVPDFSKEVVNLTPFDKATITNIDFSVFEQLSFENWGQLCIPSQKEKEEMELLWKEMIR